MVSLGKGRWKNRLKRKQITHLNCFHVVLLSVREDVFDVLMLETKQKLLSLNFHLNQEHTSDKTVFSLWLFCVLRNCLRRSGTSSGALSLAHIMPVFQRYTWHITKFVPECPCVTYRDRKGCCLKLGSLRCGSLLTVLKFRVCNVWHFINYQETLKRVG